MSENTDNRNNNAIGIDVVLSVLESGNSVELPATGYSMFPTLRPGDRVVVRPLSKGELPERGSVVVFVDDGSTVQWYNGTTGQQDNSKMAQRRKGATAQGRKGITAEGAGLRAQGKECASILVMHRLVEIKNDDAANLSFMTRGDSMMEADKPRDQEQLVGVAVSFKRGKQEYPVKSFVPNECRFKFNRRMLWILSKLERLNRVFGNFTRSK